MEFLQGLLGQPFVWGLLLGLLVCGFVWKSGWTARRHLAGELRRVEGELRDMQGHLNTQLKINATGNEALRGELEALRRQNENLRVNLAALQQKPGRMEQRMLQVHELAVRSMREQAPGFAPAWEKAFRQAEQEVEAADSGLRKLVRRVMPALGQGGAASAPVVVADDQEAG